MDEMGIWRRQLYKEWGGGSGSSVVMVRRGALKGKKPSCQAQRSQLGEKLVRMRGDPVLSD